MKVLMLGWEFPPYNKGGLGTACEGLTKSLSKKNISVTFVLPKAPEDAFSGHVNLVNASSARETTEEYTEMVIKKVSTLLFPYATFTSYDKRYQNFVKLHKKGDFSDNLYGTNLYEEVEKYAQRILDVIKDVDFDVIHAHDWMTYKAGIAVKKATGKPLIVQQHATEFDRTGETPNQYVYDIEREGLHFADKIIAVSNYTKEKVVNHYGISPDKVTVVHNGVEFNQDSFKEIKAKKSKNILFLGRITSQKGPSFFVKAAKKVIEIDPEVNFIVAGSGDLEPQMRRQAEEYGISDNMEFLGFVRGKEVDAAYKNSAVYVMPSVSEPFGITPLEAMRNATPTIISKQSGVSEVVHNTFKVDFWDVDELANKMHALVNYAPLNNQMTISGADEVRGITWDTPANKCISIYHSLL